MPGLPFEQLPVGRETNDFDTLFSSVFTAQRQQLQQDYKKQEQFLSRPREDRMAHISELYRLKEQQLRNTSLTNEEFDTQLAKLQNSFEQDALKIHHRGIEKTANAQEALQSAYADASTKINMKEQQQFSKAEMVKYLVSTGRLPAEEGQQELYKLIGVEYKPKTVQQEFQEVDAYIKDLESQFRNYFPGKRGVIEFTRTGFKEDARSATEQETVDYHTILNQLAVARRRRGEIQSQVYGRQLSVARLQNAYVQKANRSYGRGRQHLENQSVSKKVFTEKFIETGKSPTALTVGILQAIKEQSPAVSLASKFLDAKMQKTTETQKPIIQRNKRTNEERISYDSGKTWEML